MATTPTPFLPASGTARWPGPEQWLPRWMEGAVEPTSLFRRMFHSLADQRATLQRWRERLTARQSLTTSERGEERLTWSARYPFFRQDPAVVTYRCAAGSGTVERALSLHTFREATGPTWWLDRTGSQAFFRNLHVQEIAAYTATGTYTISGEALGLVPDADYYWRRPTDVQWQWIDTASDRRDGSTLHLPATGTISVRYASQAWASALASGTVTYQLEDRTSQPIPLNQQEPDNLFDGYGAVLGIPRLPGEPNTLYRDRLLAEIQAPPDSTVPGLVRGIASRLGLLHTFEWDGTNELVLDATGASGLTWLTVAGIPPLREYTEELIPAGDGYTYYATYGNWREGALVLREGIPVPGTSVSGAAVTFSQHTTGSVTASYSLAQYTVVPTVSGSLGTLRTGTGLASGNYRVLVTRRVNAHGLDQPAYQEERLLTAAGLPNGFFRAIASHLLAYNTQAVGRARWGDAARWVEFDPRIGRLAVPPSTQLPIPFDTITESTDSLDDPT